LCEGVDSKGVVLAESEGVRMWVLWKTDVVGAKAAGGVSLLFLKIQGKGSYGLSAVFAGRTG
jgi:hypothetical protein